jgi:hypothetical protein
MKLINKLYERNPALTRLGNACLVTAIVLSVYLPFNSVQVLGLNSMIKPIKFALSIAVMSYTLGWFLYYLNEKEKVKTYNRVTIIAMLFEQAVITIQAFRGEKSHFNQSSLSGIILFALMGIFILTFTIWTAFMLYLFFKQKVFTIHSTYLWGIRIGLSLFVIFSLFGGYIAQRTGHTVGSEDGSPGIYFLNWSRFFGDLRVAHFFGIHALQIIPLLSLFLCKRFSEKTSKAILLLVSLLYTSFVLFTMFQAMEGKPFLGSI